MKTNENKTLDIIIKSLVAIFLVLYLGFYYFKTNPDSQFKIARNITYFANNKFTANKSYHISNFILKCSLLINPIRL